MKKQSKRKAPAKGMGIDTILERLADLKDIATIIPTPGDGPEPMASRVAACEAATDILTALQDEGIKDPEQVRDLIHDYNALALQYQHLRHTYEEGDRPQRLGSSKVFVCPACRQQQRPGNNNCWNCGHRLIWGRR